MHELHYDRIDNRRYEGRRSREGVALLFLLFFFFFFLFSTRTIQEEEKWRNHHSPEVILGRIVNRSEQGILLETHPFEKPLFTFLHHQMIWCQTLPTLVSTGKKQHA